MKNTILYEYNCKNLNIYYYFNQLMLTKVIVFTERLYYQYIH